MRGLHKQKAGILEVPDVFEGLWCVRLEIRL